MAGKVLNKIKNAFPTIDKVSIQLLVESYNLIIAEQEYDIDWEEEQFSSHIISKMNKNCLTKKYNLHIDIEKKLLDENRLPIDNNNPKYLPRIDISIASWLFSNNEKKKYFFEAKNLCANTWSKKNGAKVSSSYYQDRYLKTGIENFRTSRYYDGAIIGYVLQGNTSNIITKLNNRLSEDTNTIQDIRVLNYIPSFKNIYSSIHLTQSSSNLEIKHIFLKF